MCSSGVSVCSPCVSTACCVHYLYMYLWFFCFILDCCCCFYFFFQAEDGIRDPLVTGVQTCALPIFHRLVAFLRGLAAPHVALQEPVHRLRLAHVLRDALHGAALRTGERPRKRPDHPLDGRVGGTEGDAGLHLDPAPPEREAELHHEQLLECHAAVRLSGGALRRGGHVGAAVGEVRLAYRLGQGPQVPALEDAVRQDVGEMAGVLVDRAPGDAAVRARRDAFHVRVDRHHAAEGIVGAGFER